MNKNTSLNLNELTPSVTEKHLDYLVRTSYDPELSVEENMRNVVKNFLSYASPVAHLNTATYPLHDLLAYTVLSANIQNHLGFAVTVMKNTLTKLRRSHHWLPSKYSWVFSTNFSKPNSIQVLGIVTRNLRQEMVPVNPVNHSVNVQTCFAAVLVGKNIVTYLPLTFFLNDPILISQTIRREYYKELNELTTYQEQEALHAYEEASKVLEDRKTLLAEAQRMKAKVRK